MKLLPDFKDMLTRGGEKKMPQVSGTGALKEKRRYTIEDYRSWPDDERRELIDGVHGGPDFIAGVLSDSTANKDLSIKKDLYERSGVKEYWLIQPDTCTVFRYVREGEKLQGKRFAPIKEFRKGEPVESVLFPGFVRDCSKAP